MSVMRIHKTKNFTVMSNYHFKERGMSLKAKGLLSLMLSLPDDWNYSISGLVKLSKDGKDSVMSALAELETFGYLTRERIQNDRGQFSGVEYNIYEEPQPQIPVSENQNEEKSHEEKSNAENQGQLNTNSIKDSFNQLYYELNTYSEELNLAIDQELIDLYVDYIAMREEMGTSLTSSGIKMLMKRCGRYSKGKIEVMKILLEAAIINQWHNVYPPTETEKTLVHELKIEELRKIYGI